MKNINSHLIRESLFLKAGLLCTGALLAFSTLAQTDPAPTHDGTSEVSTFTQINQTNPPGTIIAIAGNSRPVGYLLCDGRTLSKSNYPELHKAIGYIYGGAGENFNLPDLRGMFLRGWSSGSANDPDKNLRVGGNVIGSTQTDGFKSHNHTMDSTGGAHNHEITGLAEAFGKVNGSSNGDKRGARLVVDKYTDNAGIHAHEINSSGGLETRPKNVAVAYWIKATSYEVLAGNASGERVVLMEKPSTGYIINGESRNESGLVYRVKDNPNTGDPIFQVRSSANSVRFFVEHEGWTGSVDNSAWFAGDNDNYFESRVGIGIASPQQKLHVGGTGKFDDDLIIGSLAQAADLRLFGTAQVKELHLDPTAQWSDFVFEEDYPLLSLEEVDAFIRVNKHLPDVPSAKTVCEEGYNQSEINALLLQKIEELTLYMIELKKENDKLDSLLHLLQSEEN